MYTLGTELLLEDINTKQLFPLLDKQLSIFIIVHYTPVAPWSIKNKLRFFEVSVSLRDCSYTERCSNYTCNALKNKGLAPITRRISGCAGNGSRISGHCRDAPQPVLVPPGLRAHSGSIHHGRNPSRQRRAPGEGAVGGTEPLRGLTAERDGLSGK